MLNKFKTLIVVLFITASTQMLAQESEVIEVKKNMLCSETKLVLHRIINDYKELPLWASKLSNSNVTLFVNYDTKSWTLVQWDNNLACVMEAGEGYILKWPGKSAKFNKG
jgi:hypothetical protein